MLGGSWRMARVSCRRGAGTKAKGRPKPGPVSRAPSPVMAPRSGWPPRQRTTSLDHHPWTLCERNLWPIASQKLSHHKKTLHPLGGQKCCRRLTVAACERQFSHVVAGVAAWCGTSGCVVTGATCQWSGRDGPKHQGVA